ncbi:MAG TPA: hypothetical protein VF406_04535 [Thermodesulfobacteriota bacterium]
MAVLILIGYVWLALASLALVTCLVPTEALERWRVRRDLRKGWRWR